MILEQRPFKTFSPPEDRIWSLLYHKQWPQVQQHACDMWLEGVDLLGLQPDRIPDFAVMNERLQELVGWELVSTDVVFSDGQSWFEHLARKQFLITEYIREEKDLDYTPLPDIWHDTFGHLPLMANLRYADYIHKFAHYALKFTKEERKSLGSMWWYTVEFGFIMEAGEIKALGAGLMSSPGELAKALSNDVEKIPFSVEEFDKITPSPHEMHKKLFVLENFEQFEEAAESWLKYKFGHE